MSLMESEETNQFTFESFAAYAFYTKVNRSLVQQALAPFATLPWHCYLSGRPGTTHNRSTPYVVADDSGEGIIRIVMTLIPNKDWELTSLIFRP